MAPLPLPSVVGLIQSVEGLDGTNGCERELPLPVCFQAGTSVFPVFRLALKYGPSWVLSLLALGLE